MQDVSTQHCSKPQKEDLMKKPYMSTINFIKSFAKAYTCNPDIGAIIVN